MVSLRAWRGLLTFAQVVSASPFDGAPTSTGLPDRESRLREHNERRARDALRTGVHPVGHETGPVVYWVPGPFQAQPSPARDGPRRPARVLDFAVT